MPGNAGIGALRVPLGLDTAAFDLGLKQVQTSLGGLGKALSASFVVAGLTAFSAGVGAAVGRLEEMRKLSAQLDKALSNTGNAAKTSAKDVRAFADQLERSTGRAAEEVMKVSTNLATFGFGHDQFFRAIELANDMAAAWGGDLTQNIEGLGRALDDPIKGLAMLTKRGITFSDQQKAQIANFVKINDLAGAQGVIFEALEAQVKGVASAGYSGLTKATGNFRKALDDLFEGIAGGIGINRALEASLVGITVAIDFLTANLDTIGKSATVAGVALAVALGPAVWTMMAEAALKFGTVAKAAILGVGNAVKANPIGFLITAFAAAVAAAFLFRDNIKQAIGVDVAGVIIKVVNITVGTFVGAFNAIKATWSQLPAAIGDLVYQAAQSTVNGVIYMIREVQIAFNGLMSKLDLKMLDFGLKPLGIRVDPLKYAKIDNPFAGAAAGVNDTINSEMAKAQGTNWVGSITDMFGGATDSVKGFSDVVGTLPGALDVAGSAGKSAADKIKAGLDAAQRAAQQFADALSGGISSAFSSVVKAAIRGEDAFGAFIGKVGELGDRLIDMAFDQAIQGLFGSLLGALGGGVPFGRPGNFSIGGMAMYANGGIPPGGLSAYSNSIVSSPTLFRFASGAGLMGEAGPEAIMPLRRGSDGKLGVQVANGNERAAANGNVEFHIDARGAQLGVGAEIAQALNQWERSGRLHSTVRKIIANPDRANG